MGRFRQVCLCGIVSLLVQGLAHAELPERPLFRNFDSSHGLPSDSLHQLSLDRDGNLWIATLDGLARYDGVEFQVWRHDPGDPASLPQNDIQAVLADDHGQVWIAMQDGGVARLPPGQDRFEFWRHDPDDPDSLGDNRIWALEADGSGGIWAGGFRSVAHIGHSGQTRRLDLGGDHGCGDIVLSLSLATETGTLWLGSTQGLCRYREDSGFERIHGWHDGEPEPPAIVRIRHQGDQLWLATNRGLRLWSATAGDGEADAAALPALLHATGGAATLAEPDGTVWYASTRGIRRWQPERNETTLFAARPGRTLALQAHRFEDVLLDHEGSLWFASYGGGLAQLLPRWRAIRVYLKDAEHGEGLPDEDIFQLGSGGENRVWISFSESEGGIAELDLDSGQVQRHFTEAAGPEQPDPHVLSALRARDGCIWTSHHDHVARYCADHEPPLQRIEHDQDGRPLGGRPWRLSQAPDGRIWVGFGFGGVAWIDPATMRLQFDPLGTSSDLPCDRVSGFAHGDDGRTWLGCERGVLQVDPVSARITVVAGAAEATIDGIGLDAEGHLWLHAGDRLQQVSTGSGQTTRLREIGAERGWPAARAGGLFVDADGVVWLTSVRGLHAYDPGTDRVLHYDRDDGLPSVEFSRRTAPVALDRQRFAAATLAGVVVVDTRALRGEPLPAATLRWHRAEVQTGPNRQRLALTEQPLRLAHDHRELRVAVRLNSFVKPAAHRYRFRFDRYDTDWIEQAGQPERMIERLPSGRHRLQVTAIGSDGQAAGNPLELLIQVAPPPWRQPWAFALYALAIALILLAVQRAYRHRLQRRHALELAQERQHWAEQASLAKTRFLASIGHEIRTPMAGLLGMNALLLDSPLDPRQRHYARSVQQAGDHMLTLVNDLLDLSRIEAGKLLLEPAPLDLAALADALIDEVAAAAEAKGLRLSVRIEPGTRRAVLADGKRLTQILLNFLNNAIKFTPDGWVRLCIEDDGDATCFRVEDNGPGLSDEIRERLFQRYNQDARGRSSGGSGLGLAIAGELAPLMAGEVGADNGDNGGSRFWLRLPLPPSNEVLADGRNLPSLIVLDADHRRAGDLVASLRSLGASVEAASANGNATAGLALIATDTLADADTLLRDHGLVDRPCVLTLPLAQALPPPRSGWRLLSGPWRPLATLHACRNLIEGSPEPGTDEPTPRQTRLDGRRLLLVEDDARLREVLSARMSGLGAIVQAVDNGLLALAASERQDFDAVVLDLDLPEVDGLTFLGLLRQRHGHAAPPVIVVTARQHPDDEAQCLAAGAIAFHRKPVEIELLALELDRAINSSLHRDKRIDSPEIDR